MKDDVKQPNIYEMGFDKFLSRRKVQVNDTRFGGAYTPIANHELVTKAYVDRVGEWQDYTPTYSNITIGNGTVDARYTKIGKTVVVYVQITFGSTTTVDGSVVLVSFPKAIYDASGVRIVGVGSLHDSGSTVYLARWMGDGMVVYENTNTSNNSVQWGLIDATTPMTWATGDEIYLTATYETTE